MIIINFKNYIFGENALNLAKKIQKNIRNKQVIICPQNFDVNLISENTELNIFSQHIDLYNGDKNTGFQNINSLKKSKLKGTLLNHSEHSLSKKQIKETILEAEKNKIKIILCIPSIKYLKSFLRLKQKPYAIAFEDPDLISTGKSITKHNPQSIKKFITLLKKTGIIPLCGAGISTEKDYEEALKLGCKGVLISSAIVKSKNPDKLLKKFNSTK